MPNDIADSAMWDAATTDGDAAARREAVVRATVALSGTWPFLAAAKSNEGFEQRLALMQEQIEAGAPEDVRQEVVAGLRSKFQEMLHEDLSRTAMLRTAARTITAAEGEQALPAAYVHVHKHGSGDDEYHQVDYVNGPSFLQTVGKTADRDEALTKAREYGLPHGLPIYENGRYVEGRRLSPPQTSQEFFDSQTQRWVKVAAQQWYSGGTQLHPGAGIADEAGRARREANWGDSHNPRQAASDEPSDDAKRQWLKNHQEALDSGANVGQIDRDKAKRFRSELAKKQATNYQPDQDMAWRYHNYPTPPQATAQGGQPTAPGNGSVDVAQQQGLTSLDTDGFPLDLAQGEYAGAAAQIGRQLTPQPWVVTPGTEWPLRPNAGSFDQTPVYASKTAASDPAMVAALTGMNNGDRRSFSAHNGHSYMVRYNSEQAMGDNGQPARGYTVGGYDVSHEQSGRSLGYYRHTPHGPTLEGAKRYAADQAAEVIGRHARDQSSTPSSGQHYDLNFWSSRTAADGNKSTDDFYDYGTYDHSDPGRAPVKPCPSCHGSGGEESRCKTCNGFGNLLLRRPDDGGVGANRSVVQRSRQSSQRTATEGIVPTPGANPNYFSQGTTGLAGPAEFPQNPAGDIEPKTNNHIDEGMYDNPPPVVSGGSAQGQVDGQGYSRQATLSVHPHDGGFGAIMTHGSARFNVGWWPTQRAAKAELDSYAQQYSSARRVAVRKVVAPPLARSAEERTAARRLAYYEAEPRPGSVFHKASPTAVNEAFHVHETNSDSGIQSGFVPTNNGIHVHDYPQAIGELQNNWDIHSDNVQSGQSWGSPSLSQDKLKRREVGKLINSLKAGHSQHTARAIPFMDGGYDEGHEHGLAGLGLNDVYHFASGAYQDGHADGTNFRETLDPEEQQWESDRMRRKMGSKQFDASDFHAAHSGQKCSRWQHGEDKPAATRCRVSGGRHLGACATHAKEMTKSSATNGRIVGKCDNCGQPVRYHDEDGGHLQHLHSSSRFCADGKRATAMLVVQGSMEYRLPLARTATPSFRDHYEEHAYYSDPSNFTPREHASNDWYQLGVSDAQHHPQGRHEMIRGEHGEAAHTDYSAGFSDVHDPIPKHAMGEDVGNENPDMGDGNDEPDEPMQMTSAVIETPTPENPTGRGSDEYRARTWDGLVKMHPMQSAEDRNVNTPTTAAEPIRKGPDINSPAPGQDGGTRDEDDDDEDDD